MGNWKIDEQSAGQTVQTASASAEGYDTIFTDSLTRATDLQGALEHSSWVSEGIVEWMNECGSKGVLGVWTMTNVAIQATSDAILAYHEGNTDMAANAQSMAANADYPAEMPKADGSANPAPPKEN